MHVSEKLNTKI